MYYKITEIFISKNIEQGFARIKSIIFFTLDQSYK